ncbi:MAG: SDR family oxidoreductase [Patescibacteria group bacterium]|nr:SDR family oxidoreductase [Patescibacteria group bacterium]
MQTVLIAGGAGFIGSHLTKSLLSENYKVICLDNFLTGDRKNIDDLLENPNFKFIESDITKPIESIEISDVNFIFHLASPASPNKKSPRSYINFPVETLLVNSVGTKNLLDLAKKSGAKFLYASSSEIYGNPLVSPQKEEYFGNVNPNGIRSVYDEGKRFGEAITMAYFRKYNMDVRIIRIFNTYGPLMQIDDGRVVSNFINQAIKNEKITIYGDGLQTRSFCYIDDMVKGLELSMFSGNTKGQVFNLGNPLEKTIGELAKIIISLTNSESEIVFEDLPEDDPKKRNPDIEKAQKTFGFKPQVSIEDGVLRTIEYFKSL